MGRTWSKNKWLVISLLFVSVCFADIGDMTLTDNLILLDDKYVGLGSTAGRIVFEDASPDKVIIRKLLNGIFESATTNDLVEVARFQAESSGTVATGFGTSVNFYSEASNGTAWEIGALAFEPQAGAINSEAEFALYKYDVQSGELVAHLKSYGDTIGFYEVNSDKYGFLNITELDGADRNLTIVMGGASRVIDFSGGSSFDIENDAAVNQDLTSDASPTFAGLTLTSDLDVAGTITVTRDYAVDVSAVPAFELDGNSDLMPITGYFNDMNFDLDSNDDIMPAAKIHFVIDDNGDVMPDQ